VVIALGFACFHLGWWSLLDGMLLTLLIAVTMTMDAMPRPTRWVGLGSVLLILAPGALLLFGQTRTQKDEALVEADVIALIERDLAYWLSNQAGPGGAVVLAPPSLTTSLYFHGGLSGLSTPYWENKDGFAAAVRIAGATSPDEAQVMAQGRNLTYVIVPSWDPFMDEYARLGSREPDRSLVALLHRWLPPRWLRAVPYQLPKIPGFAGLSVVIFQVTDLQDNSTALSRLAEYFVEMGQADQAAEAGLALERLFPEDLGAWVARTLVYQAQGNTPSVANAIKELPAYIARGDDSALPWDRRVNLAIALAEGKRFETARDQLKQCLAELDETRLRSLTTVSLYRLEVLSKAFGLEITDPKLRELSRGLLPPEMRGNL
jgi:tetratricopeptide (TPR) repeat protein